MSVQDSLFITITTIFTLITIIFIIRYCKLLIVAKNEYAKAKNIVSGIVFTFKKHQDGQNETINHLAFQIEIAQSAIERLTNRSQGIESKIKSLARIADTTPTIYREAIDHVNSIKKEINVLSENQQNLQKQLVTLEEKMQVMSKEEKGLVIVDESKSFSKLTETEQVVLQFLIDEGEKTSPEVEKKIGKTREHTARLMKKLWQEGYIERDTHRIPYVYRATENLKKMEIKA